MVDIPVRVHENWKEKKRFLMHKSYVKVTKVTTLWKELFESLTK